MPDPYTDSNIALTPAPAVMPPPSGPEGGFFPDQNAGQMSTGADYNANRTAGSPALGAALNTGTAPLQIGLSPHFEGDVSRVTKMLNPPGMGPLAKEADQADAERLKAEQQQKIADAEGKDKAYSTYAGTAKAALENYKNEMASAPLPAFVPTKETAADLSTLGALLGIVGFMAGRGKGLQPGLAAMDSMTGMLKGWQQGRKDLYEREYTQFKANFDRTIKAHEEYSRELDKAFATSQVDLQKGLNEANTAAVKAGDAVMQAAIKQGSAKRAMELMAGQRQAAAKATELVMQMEAKQAARLGITPYDEGTLRAMADQYLAGDKSVLAGLGSGNIGAMNRFAMRQMIQRVMQERGMTGADVAAKLSEYQGLTAGIRAIGTRSANAELAVNEAMKMQRLVEQASDAVDRSDFRLIAKGENAWSAETGDTNIVKFTAALNSFVQVYVRAVAPTGVPTESVRQHAYEMLNTAMSKEQVKATLQQLDAEMQAALDSPAMAFETFTSRISGRPTKNPIEDKGAYSVGQVIDKGGKKYRVVGGDMNDPDVEPVQ